MLIKKAMGKTITGVLAASVMLACQKNDDKAKETTRYGICKGGTVYEFNPSSGVIGGRRVDKQEDIAASTVFLAYSKSDGKYQYFGTCTGTLIDKDIVLTAAHCVEESKYDYSSLRVYFTTEPVCEEVSGTITSENRKISELIIHSSYGSKSAKEEGDIALLRLSSSAPESATPAKVLDPKSDLKEDSVMLAAGFGRTVDMKSADSKDYAPIALRKTEFKWPSKQRAQEMVQKFRVELVKFGQEKYGTTLPDDKVKETYPDGMYDFNPSGKTIFVDQNGVEGSVCKGDSGGPLYLRVNNGEPQVIGVTNRAESANIETDGLCSGLAAYANVGYYKSWLNDKYSSLKKYSKFPKINIFSN